MCSTSHVDINSQKAKADLKSSRCIENESFLYTSPIGSELFEQVFGLNLWRILWNYLGA